MRMYAAGGITHQELGITAVRATFGWELYRNKYDALEHEKRLPYVTIYYMMHASKY